MIVAINSEPTKLMRIPALDFTKGALVLFMVLYHWLNYFIGPEGEYYRYLRFLTPSFILITGFMISHVYLSKYAPNDSRLSRRLFIRALKLLAIFVFLNAARTSMLPLLGASTPARNALDLGALLTIFGSGNVPASSAKLVSFSILLPISYLLMLSGALMLPYSFYRFTFYLAWILLLASSVVLDLFGLKSQNLELVAIGMLGVVIGFSPITAINKFIRHPFVLVFAYLLYLLAITRLNVSYPLEIAGTCLSVVAIYSVGTIKYNGSRIQDEVILLGKYSLFGYISQIAILQFLKVILRHLELGAAALIVSLCGAVALTILSVKVLDHARMSTPSVDRLYKAAFN